MCVYDFSQLGLSFLSLSYHVRPLLELALYVCICVSANSQLPPAGCLRRAGISVKRSDRPRSVLISPRGDAVMLSKTLNVSLLGSGGGLEWTCRPPGLRCPETSSISGFILLQATVFGVCDIMVCVLSSHGKCDIMEAHLYMLKMPSHEHYQLLRFLCLHRTGIWHPVSSSVMPPLFSLSPCPLLWPYQSISSVCYI